MIKRKYHHYIWQPLLLVLFLASVLALFYWGASSSILWAVGAGSLASSAFITFGKPSAVARKPLNILVSYFVAIAVGILCRFIIERAMPHCSVIFDVNTFCWTGFFAAFSVGFLMLVLSALRVEHPPAAGIALVLVLDVKDYQTLIIILFSVIMLSILSGIFGRWMRDLF